MTEVSVVATGVPPLPRDGTPVCLEPAMSDDALESLDFSAALDVVAEFAAGPLGAADLRARRPTADTPWISHELALVGELMVIIRRGGHVDVAPVPELRGALGRLRVAGSVLELAELAAVRVTLDAGRAMVQELERHAENAPLVAALRTPPLDRAIERALALAIGDDGDLLDTASPALAAARRAVHAARERVVRRLEAIVREAEAGAVPSGATVTMREGRYVIPVRRDARNRPAGIIHDESGSAGTLFVEPTAAIELGNALRSAEADEERQVLIVLRELTERLRPVRDEVAALHAMCVRVDSLVARARWACTVDAEVPALSVDGTCRLTRARHPLLLARGIDVVPFDLALDATEHTLLISGPNTGGKTVLLKTIGVVIALTQAGVVAPLGAESAVPVRTKLFVDIGDHQSIAADLSTFSAHVATLRRTLDHADDGTLILLDEIGSGTDPAEGGALAMAVLEAFTSRRALTIATTHLGALKALATRVPGIVNGSLQFDAATLSPTYRFTKGVPGRSYGLAIARRLGVDRDVLATAEALVPDAERELDRLLAEAEARRQELDRREQAQREREHELEAREAVVSATADVQATREAALRQQEKSAERERARAAKAYLLEARRRVEEALAAAQGAADEAEARRARRLVEDAIRMEAQRLDEPEPDPVGSAGGLRVGGRVRLNTGSTGDLAELRADGKAVVLVGTMRLVVSAASLVALPGAPTNTNRTRAPVRVDAPEQAAAYELDLRGMRADEAEAAVRLAIDHAVLAEQPHLAIIHGMGTGVLRDTVRTLLAGDRRVASYDFAPRQQGGVGVTIAVLR